MCSRAGCARQGRVQGRVRTSTPHECAYACTQPARACACAHLYTCTQKGAQAQAVHTLQMRRGAPQSQPTWSEPQAGSMAWAGSEQGMGALLTGCGTSDAVQWRLWQCALTFKVRGNFVTLSTGASLLSPKCSSAWTCC